MMSEHLGEVFDPLAGLALNPCRRGPVATRAFGSWDLRVRDVADEQVPEGIFSLALHRARPRRPDQLLSGKLMKRQFELGRVAPADLGEGSLPEDLPYHRRVVKEALTFRR